MKRASIDIAIAGWDKKKNTARRMKKRNNNNNHDNRTIYNETL